MKSYEFEDMIKYLISKGHALHDLQQLSLYEIHELYKEEKKWTQV